MEPTATDQPKTPAKPPVATSNSSTCGRVKLLHPGRRDEGTLAGYRTLGKHGARVFHGAARGAPATHTRVRRGGKLDSQA